MVDINLELEFENSITSEELDMRLKILGELIINEVKKIIRDLNLIGDTADYLQKWVSDVRNGTLIIENATEYATYLEYGTYSYWQKHGLDTYTDPSDPKKKDLPSAERSKYPKGMQAFGVVRRVVYNPKIMERLVQEAFS